MCSVPPWSHVAPGGTPGSLLAARGTYVDVVIDPDLPVTLHEQLAAILRARIASGEYASRIPSATTLAQEFGVSHRTSEHALRTLRDEGLIVAVFGRGYFVS